MNIENMRRILAIIEEKSISNAAQKMFISQPSLSQMVKAVETELGVALFDRRGKELKLTYAGEKFAVLARKTVSSWDYYLQDVQGIKTGTVGKIVVGMTMRRGLSYLPAVLPEFIDRFPGVVVEQVVYNSHQSEECLIKGVADIAFGTVPIKNPQIVSIPLHHEQYMVIASRKSDFFLKHADDAYEKEAKVPKQLSFSELKDEKLILLQSRFESRKQIEAVAQTIDLPLNIIMDVASVDTAIGLAKVGLGITVSPMVVTNRGALCNRDGELGYFLLKDPELSRGVFLSYEKSVYQSEAHVNFIKLVEKHFGKKNIGEATGADIQRDAARQ